MTWKDPFEPDAPLADGVAFDRAAVFASWVQGWGAARFYLHDVRRWQGVGIYDPLEAAGWRDAGFSPEDAASWAPVVMYDPLEAAGWRDLGFSPVDASSWQRAGIYDPLEAARWSGSGFSPEEAGSWARTLFTVEEAVAWRQARFSAKQAEAWSEALFNLKDAAEWRDSGFSVQEAENLERGGTSLRQAVVRRDSLMTSPRPAASASIPGTSGIVTTVERAAKYRRARNWLGVVAAGLFFVAFILLAHAWSYSDSVGDVGTCASVLSGSEGDTMSNLAVGTPESQVAFCDQQRSTHRADAEKVGLFGLLAVGAAWSTHRAGQPDR